MKVKNLEVGLRVQYKFKVGDKVRCVEDYLRNITLDQVYTIRRSIRGVYMVRTDSDDFGWYAESVFELVEQYLTPEEVFEHLRKGTKLEYEHEYKHNGYTVTEWKACANPQFANILNRKWRIKPEPEIITLNGKRYQAIED